MSEPDRFQEILDRLTERPRDVELLVTAGDLAEERGRTSEAWLYWKRAIDADLTLRFLVARLKRVAVDPDQQKFVAELEAQPPDFAAALRGIWRYPITGPTSGTFWAGVVCATAFHFVVYILNAAVLFALIVVPYLMIFYMNICRTTAMGSDDVPFWPELRDLFQLVGAFLRFFTAWVAAFWPVMVLGTGFALAMTEVLGLVRTLPAVPLAILGSIYLPMAFLANTMFDGVTPAFRYGLCIRSISRAWKPYRILVVASFVATLIAGVGAALVQNEYAFFLIGPALYFLELYGMALLMRAIGLFYRYHKHELGWELEVK